MDERCDRFFLLILSPSLSLWVSPSLGVPTLCICALFVMRGLYRS